MSKQLTLTKDDRIIEEKLKELKEINTEKETCEKIIEAITKNEGDTVRVSVRLEKEDLPEAIHDRFIELLNTRVLELIDKAKQLMK